MATPTIEELMARIERQLARIELLESRSASPTAPPVAGQPAQSEQPPPRITSRGLVRTAAAGTAGLVGGMLIEPGAALASTAGPHGPESFASSTGTPAITATSTGKGNAIMATSANAAAVHGSQKSSAAATSAIKGTIDSPNGEGTGVWGTSPAGSGVTGTSKTGIGVTGTASSGGYGVLGDTSDGNGYGVYGDASSGCGVAGSTSSGTGVYGGASSGTAVRGATTSGYGVYGSSSSNYGVAGTTTSGNGVYGQVTTASQAGVVGRQEDASGNWALFGFGNIGASGTKSAVVPAADGNGHLTLYCMESPECWFEDFGSAKLSKGSASVRIDPEFAQTVDTGDYFVFVQAEGECKGLSVRGKTGTGFVVRELGSGTSNASFAYRIVARRKDVLAPRLNRITLPDAPREAS